MYDNAQSGIQAGTQNYLSAAKAEPSAISAASYALDDARALAARVDDLVNRLCGGVPQAVGQAPDGKVGSILNGLRHDADRTLEMIRSAQSQLNRLEREVM